MSNWFSFFASLKIENKHLTQNEKTMYGIEVLQISGIDRKIVRIQRIAQLLLQI